MNDALEWNSVAPDYEKEVFDVYKNDKKRILWKTIRQYAGKSHSAVDFGCGIGKALPLLSPLFRVIIATDISRRCIEIAKDRGYPNVRFVESDLTMPLTNIPQGDFLLCCNVAISEDNKKNFRILSNALKTIKKNGIAVFVIPSLESISFASWMIIHMHGRENIPFPKIPNEDIRHLAPEFYKGFRNGIVNIEDIPTKHYLLTELIAFFNKGKNQILAIERVEYDWETELRDLPPKNLKVPDPWDWMVVVKRIN
ncbi:MAG: class I SAM-dependent methyltransferase [Bacteroidia bacterium]|nr:class I SAM-dependent methyltransferase [Bacteroidia bacterium]